MHCLDNVLYLGGLGWLVVMDVPTVPPMLPSGQGRGRRAAEQAQETTPLPGSEDLSLKTIS